jgi:hypothetical protein
MRQLTDGQSAVVVSAHEHSASLPGQGRRLPADLGPVTSCPSQAITRQAHRAISKRPTALGSDDPLTPAGSVHDDGAESTHEP